MGLIYVLIFIVMSSFFVKTANWVMFLGSIAYGNMRKRDYVLR